MASVEVTLAALDEAALTEWLLERRWFGSKARDVAQLNVLDVVVIHDGPPALASRARRGALPRRHARRLPAPARHAAGRLRRGGRRRGRRCRGLRRVRRPRRPATCSAACCATAPRSTASTPASSSIGSMTSSRRGPAPRVRAIGAEQSNTSIVFDEALVLKAFRRVEAGDNPELEMLRFLSAAGFPNIAPLGGWYQYEGELMDATFGVVQRFVARRARRLGARARRARRRDPERFVTRLRDLGGVIGRDAHACWPPTRPTPPSRPRSRPTSRWRC